MKRNEPLESYRTAAIEQLSAAYTADRLDMEEFERRLELVNAAENGKEIREALSGLPVIEEEEPTWTPDSTAAAPMVTVLSERKLTGDWLDGRSATTVSVLGTTRIDLREVDPRLQEISINLVTIMGETRIIVPPDMRVDNRVVPILAEVNVRHPRTQDPKFRTLRLTGVALMGEVRVDVKR